MWRNFWNTPVLERLTGWKDFRGALNKMPLKKALEQVNAMWGSAPYVNYYLAADNPSSWPDPWTLLAENYYCDVAKALGIIYTINFTRHKSAPLSLRICYDYKDKNRFNLVYMDNGKYILNYWPNELVNNELIEEKNFQLLYQYSAIDLSLDKY